MDYGNDDYDLFNSADRQHLRRRAAGIIMITIIILIVVLSTSKGRYAQARPESAEQDSIEAKN